LKQLTRNTATLIKIAIGLLILAIFPWPYSYYILLRWVICGISTYIAWRTHKETSNWLWFILIAIVFNPVMPLFLNRAIWTIIDFTVIFFYWNFLKSSSLTKNNES